MESTPLVSLLVPRPEQTMFKAASNALATAKAYVIDSPDMRDLAARELTKIKTLQKSLDSTRKGITSPIDAAKKAVMDLFRAPTDYLEQAEAILKTAIGSYDREQERRRIAEQARLEEAARKERARLEAEAAAREAAARAEAERIQQAATQAAQSGDAETAARLEAQAQSRVEQGAAEAQTLQQTATLITAPVATPALQSAGVSTRRVWKTEVTDKLALVKYVAGHPEYLELLDANMPAINRIGLALRQACPIEGIRVFEADVIAARAT